jgi:hypothetical protein
LTFPDKDKERECALTCSQWSEAQDTALDTDLGLLIPDHDFEHDQYHDLDLDSDTDPNLTTALK